MNTPGRMCMLNQITKQLKEAGGDGKDHLLLGRYRNYRNLRICDVGAILLNCQGIVFQRVDTRFELAVEFFAVDDQHGLGIHIGASHIQVLGSNDGEAVVDQDRFSVGRVISKVFAKGNACVQDFPPVPRIIGGGHKIIAYRCGI